MNSKKYVYGRPGNGEVSNSELRRAGTAATTIADAVKNRNSMYDGIRVLLVMNYPEILPCITESITLLAELKYSRIQKGLLRKLTRQCKLEIVSSR